MTRVFIVHGWGDKPGDHWMPWLKGQLELKGFTVAAPAMPRTEAPAIGAWISHLRREVGETGEAAYYVGHSIGCQTIMRHLEQLPAGTHLLKGLKHMGVESGMTTFPELLATTLKALG